MHVQDGVDSKDGDLSVPHHSIDSRLHTHFGAHDRQKNSPEVKGYS